MPNTQRPLPPTTAGTTTTRDARLRPWTYKSFLTAMLWSFLLPVAGAAAGYGVAQSLGGGLQQVSMGLGFLIGEYCAIRFGRTSSSGRLFWLILLGGVFWGWRGFVVVAYTGLVIIHRNSLARVIQRALAYIDNHT